MVVDPRLQGVGEISDFTNKFYYQMTKILYNVCLPKPQNKIASAVPASIDGIRITYGFRI